MRPLNYYFFVEQMKHLNSKCYENLTLNDFRVRVTASDVFIKSRLIN